MAEVVKHDYKKVEMTVYKKLSDEFRKVQDLAEKGNISARMLEFQVT